MLKQALRNIKPLIARHSIMVCLAVFLCAVWQVVYWLLTKTDIGPTHRDIAPQLVCASLLMGTLATERLLYLVPGEERFHRAPRLFLAPFLFVFLGLASLFFLGAMTFVYAECARLWR